MTWRTKARGSDDIIESIDQLLSMTPGVESIHLIPSDFNKVWEDPARHGCVKQPDNSLVKTYAGRLVNVVSVQ